VSQTWMALSIVVWAILVVASWLLIRPAITDDSPSAVSKMAAGSGITHLGLVIGLVLMIWKPGL
jgi:NADH:ubiquinone oxidoreductase subunit 5 (subunit L)/multisubunit Na+/H+ antiporter MnhA subunit